MFYEGAFFRIVMGDKHATDGRTFDYDNKIIGKNFDNKFIGKLFSNKIIVK